MKELKPNYKGMFILRISLTAVQRTFYKDFFKINVGIITFAILVSAFILIISVRSAGFEPKSA